MAAFATLVCQRNCVFLCKGTKLKIVMPVFCGTELRFGSLCNLGLSKKLRFSLQRHKTREFGEAEFLDCLPVSALVCFFAFDTGGLGLWLGAFGRSRLYRCQSVPGPPMPVFCDTELRFGIEIPLIYATAECQNLRIRLVPNSWIVCFELWHRAASHISKVQKTFIPGD